MPSKEAAVREKGVDSPAPGTSSGNASRENLSDGGYGSSDDHIFKDPAVANHWRGVFERAGYENRHRFDPEFTWTAEEEKKLVRKLDIRIMLWAWIMFCGLDLHRRNINRAISDNMLPELGNCFPISHFLSRDLLSFCIKVVSCLRDRGGRTPRDLSAK
jgi:hypothetical protein